MPPKPLWVPMPASQLYKAGGAEPESMRDRLVRQYGSASVTEAELSCVLDLMMVNGIVSPSEFIDLMGKKLTRIDEKRRIAARLETDS